MARLVVVSNRVPMPREKLSRAGGLAVALREALAQQGGLWFGWSGETNATAGGAPKYVRSGRVEFATIDLTPEEHKAFYVDFANSTLWPLCHYRLGLIDFNRAAFKGYIQVNMRFARELQPFLRPDDVIWVHDYHFIPLAAELRRLGVKNRIGYFQHIPFPAPEVLTALPGHERLIADLCHYDLIGFQTAGDVRALKNYLALEAPAQTGGQDTPGFSDTSLTIGCASRVAAFPIGIDVDGFERIARAEMQSEETQRLIESLVGRSLVIGVDRLDYSKGIPQRFEAFSTLLSHRPEHRGKVTYMQVAPISRGDVTQYRKLRNELERLTGHINGRFAEFDWVPVRYLNKAMSRNTLAGFYRVARVGLVTPLRDGMNLVAKEYVAAQDPDNPGVLVLSRFAGAAQELTGALIINPYDSEQMSDAVHRALGMPLAERQARWNDMMAALRGNTIGHWRDKFLSALMETKVGLELVS